MVELVEILDVIDADPEDVIVELTVAPCDNIVVTEGDDVE